MPAAVRCWTIPWAITSSSSTISTFAMRPTSLSVNDAIRVRGAARRLHGRGLPRAAHAARAAAGAARDGAPLARRGPGGAPASRPTGRSSRCGELIDDVLFLCELETGREVVALGDGGGARSCARWSAELAERAGRPGSRRSRRSRTRACTCRCGARMLRVVVENLPENALRYAGEGATCTISLRAPRAPDRSRSRQRRRRRRGGPAAALRALLPRRPGPRLARHRARPGDRQARHRGRRRGGRSPRRARPRARHPVRLPASYLWIRASALSGLLDHLRDRHEEELRAERLALRQRPVDELPQRRRPCSSSAGTMTYVNVLIG